MDTFLQKECDLQFFHNNGFIRKKCSNCGSYFWTLDNDIKLCGDKPCVEFSFINNPIGKKTFSLAEVRESFLSFFEHNNHSRLRYPQTGERFPVVARWRSDIYLTIASIADFQPHVTSGEVPPPANPLVISQPCIRLNDLEEIGVSGRHLSTFEMMGHHAFNRNTDEIYWKEKTVEYCDEFFRKSMGLPRKAINYKEQLWGGGGNAGPCLEVLAGGLEIATLVFMNMKEDKNGEFDINGKKYSKNPLNIVDTGYGLERISWLSKGTTSIYETVFQDTIKWLKDNAEHTTDMISIYSLADHSKCLAFMLGDGIVPSNVKAGYLARLIIRRALRFIEKIKLHGSLREIVDIQLDLLEKDFPSLKKSKNQIDEILDIETKRFLDTIYRGEKLVKKVIKEKGNIDREKLIDLYDTHGMPPDIVQKIAENKKVDVEVPKNFESMVAELHSHEKKEETADKKRLDLPETKLLFYEDHYIKDFEATVLWKNLVNHKTEIILDQTAFYPEGGGQPSDKGYFSNGKQKIRVKNVKKEGNSIIHIVEGDLEVGEKIKGVIDWNFRYMLMKHHTGTHLVNGALRELLGDHIWQAGSQLRQREARFDFSHYKKISDKEKRIIEKRANEFIKKQCAVEKKIMDRNNAEQKFGFRLYQGGVPPGNEIRVLNIPGIDVEACGGTHINNTGEIEKIRILKTERIQDGVNRIIFAAGKMADAFLKGEQKLFEKIIQDLSKKYIIEEKEEASKQLAEAAKIFSVPVKQLQKTIQRFMKETELKNDKKTVDTLPQVCELLFEEWKNTRKRIKKKSAEFSIDAELKKEKQIETTDKNIKIVFEDIPEKLNPIARAGKIVEKEGHIAYISSGNKATIAASEDVDIDLRIISKKIGELLGGSGGGKPRMAHCGGKRSGSNKEIIKKAEELIVKQLKENK